MQRIATAIVLVMSPLWAQAQEEPPKPPKPQRTSKASDWELTTRVRADLEYNDNVFLLSGDSKQRLDDDRPADQVSGRYDDMDSVDDLVLTPSIEIQARGPSVFGRKLEISVGLEYPEYLENSRRSHLRTHAEVAQQIGPDGRLALGLKFIPEYFNKNYLADAIDPTGSVTADERVYDAGVYREWELELEYRHEIVEEKSFSLDGIVTLGLRDRSYDSPFGGRNEDARTLGLALRFGAGKSVHARLHYTLEDVDSPTRSEVLLLDEPAFAADLNGDGDAIDVPARTVQLVDRSRRGHRFGASIGFRTGEGASLELGWTRALKNFDSDEPLDVVHRDRRDTRDAFEIAFKFRLTKDWDARIGYEHAVQDTDRPEDPDAAGETLDYRRNVFLVSVDVKW